MSKMKYVREEIYKKICKLVYLPPTQTRTGGYFDAKQMRHLLEYIEKREGTQENGTEPAVGISAVRLPGDKEVR